MDFVTRKKLYNRCDPREPLGPLDDRNVDVDQNDQENAVRGERWVERLLRRIELSGQPLCELLTGLPGSGKSTELKRLQARLEEPHGQKLLAVYVDAEEQLDLANEIDIPDLLATIVAATERRVLEAEHKDPQLLLAESYQVRLWKWLTSTEVGLTGAEVALGDAAKLTLELKTRPSFRQQVRAKVAQHLLRFVEDVRTEMITFLSRARAAGYQGIVVIYDSLEKLRGTSLNYTDVLDSCERVFAQGAPYLRLPVHVVYTVPPALLSRTRVPVDFFPMLKLKTRVGAHFEPGMNAARTIVARRVPSEILEEQLGPIWRERVDELLLWSGGFPREIVRLLRLIIEQDGPLTDNAFRRVLARVSDEYRDLVQRSQHAWLADLALNKRLAIDDDEQRRAADRMLSANAVMRYLNQDSWWDVHPAVRALPEIQAAIERLELEQKRNE